jgi:hypothetical protein
VTITVTLGRAPELSPEERQQRIRRAAEVLEGAGWLFDEHISAMTQQLLDATMVIDREDIHRSIRVAAELKARLVQIVNSKTLEDKRNERRG